MFCTNITYVLLLLHLSSANASSFYFQNIVNVMKYFGQFNVRLATIFTCPEGSLPKFNAYSSEIFEHNAVSVNYLRANSTYFSPKQQIYYHPEIFFVEPGCQNLEYLLQEAYAKNMFTTLYYWVFIDPFSDDSCNSYSLSERARSILGKAKIYVNSQVFWIQSDCDGNAMIYDVYHILPKKQFAITYLGKAPDYTYDDLNLLLPLSRRRQNLRNIILRTAAVLTQPDRFTYMEDPRTMFLETTVKWTYPMIKRLAEDLNFRYHLSWLDNNKYDHNKTGEFIELFSLIQKKQMDFGMFGMVVRLDRLPVVDFTVEAVPLISKILFRQPPLARVSNIFVIPFTRDVWISCLGLGTLIGLLMTYQLLMENRLYNYGNTWFDSVTFVTGTMCQQGSTLDSKNFSLRLTILLAFVSSLFLFSSYSANFVALLQSPSSSIKTLDDLVSSHLEVGIEDLYCHHVSFQESKSPSVKKLLQKKIIPRGDEGFMNLEEGLERIKYGLFAIHGEINSIYEYVNKNYTEDQKCGLGELDTVQIPQTSIPLQKLSPFRELFTTRLRWQRDVGLYHQIRKKLVAQVPLCKSGRVEFLSVGIIEITPALLIIICGCLLSASLFFLEYIMQLLSKPKVAC